MSDYCRMSEALYVGLCGYIGSPTEVTVRREVVDMEEMMQKAAHRHTGMRDMTSGSYREGFRFNSSDRDTMLWSTNHKVIADLSQSSVYDLSKHTIIIMEDTGTPPGFVRLQLLTSARGSGIEFVIVQSSDGMYLSSLRWRQIMLTMISGHKSFNNTKRHGPCANGFIGDKENDYVLCFHSSYWSRLTCYWKKRCTLHNWPPNHVFNDILTKGCHFVPVGNKIAADENELDMEIILFAGRTKTSLFHESHTISLLRTFKTVSNGSRQSRHRGTIPVFIFHENNNVLANTNRKYHMVSKLPTGLFLEMLQISVTLRPSRCVAKFFHSTKQHVYQQIVHS